MREQIPRDQKGELLARLIEGVAQELADVLADHEDEILERAFEIWFDPPVNEAAEKSVEEGERAAEVSGEETG